ncbi:MAG: DUF4383 domain-containing protein [Bdellovibrionota bacterium]
MNPRGFALYGGIIMLVIGALALVAPGPTENLPALLVETSYGWFLNTFAMNIYNKVALIAFGVFGIWAAKAKGRELPSSIFWAQALFVVMGVLMVLGLFTETSTLGGYWPLFGANAGLHAFVAIVGAYYGFALSSKVHKPTKTELDYRTPLQPRI